MIFKEGHFLTAIAVCRRALYPADVAPCNAPQGCGACGALPWEPTGRCLTMPLLICCRMPEPWEPLRHVDGRRERIDCIDDVSKNGTLDDVFGIEPPYTHHIIVISALTTKLRFELHSIIPCKGISIVPKKKFMRDVYCYMYVCTAQVVV